MRGCADFLDLLQPLLLALHVGEIDHHRILDRLFQAHARFVPRFGFHGQQLEIRRAISRIELVLAGLLDDDHLLTRRLELGRELEPNADRVCHLECRLELWVEAWHRRLLDEPIEHVALRDAFLTQIIELLLCFGNHILAKPFLVCTDALRLRQALVESCSQQLLTRRLGGPLDGLDRLAAPSLDVVDLRRERGDAKINVTAPLRGVEDGRKPVARGRLLHARILRLLDVSTHHGEHEHFLFERIVLFELCFGDLTILVDLVIVLLEAEHVGHGDPSFRGLLPGLPEELQIDLALGHLWNHPFAHALDRLPAPLLHLLQERTGGIDTRERAPGVARVGQILDERIQVAELLVRHLAVLLQLALELRAILKHSLEEPREVIRAEADALGLTDVSLQTLGVNLIELTLDGWVEGELSLNG